MKTVFDAACVEELQRRLAGLQPVSPRKWGKMSIAQMLAHCSKGIEMAAGELCPERVLIGRIIGRLIKRAVLGDDKPMRRDSPTARELVAGAHPTSNPRRRASAVSSAVLLLRVPRGAPAIHMPSSVLSTRKSGES
jgi:hypothetical protein